MRTFALIILLFACSTSTAQQADTTYFDKNWEPCSASEKVYYRISRLDTTTMPPLRLIKQNDYYPDGTMEMEGYVLADDTSKDVGLFRWYSKKGACKTLRCMIPEQACHILLMR